MEMNQKTLNEQLLDACTAGDFVELERVIKAGADVNGRNKFGSTALMLAADDGCIETI